MPKIVATQLDWIQLGFDLFTDCGEIGLNVDKMSRILKCNKSSFYWHFKTKKEFIDHLVNYWINNDTTKIIQEVSKQSTPKNKLIKLLEISFKKDSNLDFIFYLKKYAQKNEKTLKLVEGIDEERIEFVACLLMEINYSSDEARTKASLIYKYLIGYHEMIRYKEQNSDYLSEVLLELNHFINVDYDTCP